MKVVLCQLVFYIDFYEVTISYRREGDFKNCVGLGGRSQNFIESIQGMQNIWRSPYFKSGLRDYTTLTLPYSEALVVNGYPAGYTDVLGIKGAPIATIREHS